MASEYFKTVAAEVVISPDRVRGPDNAYPAQAKGAKSPQTQRICNAANMLLSDPAAPTGLSMETVLLEAAGARSDEPLETQRAKIARWWNATDLRCSLLGSDIHGVLAMMIESPGLPQYIPKIIDQIVVKYALPLNDIASDGRTALDVITDRIDGISGETSTKQRYTRAYGALRRLGARHRLELERSGQITTVADAAEAETSRLVAAANAGDAGAAWSLAWRYAGDPHVTPDPAQASAWMARAEASALTNRDGPVLARIGETYLDIFRDANDPVIKPNRPPFSGKRDRAVAILEAALAGKFAADQAEARSDAQYNLGYAHYMGFGTPQNWDKALPLLAPLRENMNAQIWAAQILVSKGRRKEAIPYLRPIAFSSRHSAPFQGTTVAEWLKAQPEGLCGPDTTGFVWDGC